MVLGKEPVVQGALMVVSKHVTMSSGGLGLKPNSAPTNMVEPLIISEAPNSEASRFVPSHS